MPEPNRGRPIGIEELRQRQLVLLDRLVEVCDRLGLRYYLCAGTLLGAVRHQGYIPWDDDIDVMLPRRDYEVLCREFEDDEALSLRSSRRTPGYVLPFAKVCDERTRLEVESDIVEDIGIYVDVFPVDGWLRDRRRRVQRAALGRLLDLMRVKHLSVEVRRRSRARNAVLRLAKLAVVWLPTAWVAAALTRVATWGDLDRCDEAGVIVWGYQESVPAAAYGAPRPLVFEGRDLAGPADPETVLSVLYGRYMELPPPEARVTHHRFTAYEI